MTSACYECKHLCVEGQYYPATLESPEEFPEMYCEFENDENFLTPYGCWDFKRSNRAEEEAE